MLMDTNSHNCLENIQQQKYAIALTNCWQVIENDVSNLDADLNSELVYYYLGYSLAIARYQFIIEQNLCDYRAFYNRGLINSARGEYWRAIAQQIGVLRAKKIVWLHRGYSKLLKAIETVY